MTADDFLLLTVLKEIRADLREHRTLLLQLVDANQRSNARFDTLERRMGDLRPDLELMLKGELLGRLTHFETQIENRLDELEARLPKAN